MIRHRISLVFAAIATVLVAALVMIGCSETAAHKARRAAAGISSGLTQLQAENEKWYAAGKLTPDETVAIANGISDATLFNDEFDAHIKAVAAIDPNNAASLVNYAQTLIGSLDRLNQNIASVSDPGIQSKLRLAFAAAETGLDLLRALISQAQPYIGRGAPVLSAWFIKEEFYVASTCA